MHWFKKGDKFRVENSGSHPHLNGREGVVTGYLPLRKKIDGVAVWFWNVHIPAALRIAKCDVECMVPIKPDKNKEKSEEKTSDPNGWDRLSELGITHADLEEWSQRPAPLRAPKLPAPLHMPQWIDRDISAIISKHFQEYWD